MLTERYHEASSEDKGSASSTCSILSLTKAVVTLAPSQPTSLRMMSTCRGSPSSSMPRAVQDTGRLRMSMDCWVHTVGRHQQEERGEPQIPQQSYNGGLSKDGQRPTWEDFYASMPPISALRVLFALATSKAPDLEGRCATCPRTNAWSSWKSRKRISGLMRVIELPAEAGVDTSKSVGLLRKSLYGTRDAPTNWERPSFGR